MDATKAVRDVIALWLRHAKWEESEIDQMTSEVITAYLEASGIQKNAERYRWLREQDVEIYSGGGGKLISIGFGPSDLDASIDEARK